MVTDLDARIVEVPVAGWLSPEDMAVLRNAEFDVDLFHQVPMAGPIEPDELVEIAPKLRQTVSLIQQLSLAGPVEGRHMVQLSRLDPEMVRSVAARMPGTDADQLLAALPRQGA